jgi:hypothetical protein
MSTNLSTSKSAAKVIAVFLLLCLLFAPSRSNREAETEVAVKPSQIPSVSATAKTDLSLLKLKPAPAPKAWFAGKKILSSRELSYLLYQAGFRGKEHRLAWIVAMGESTGRPKSFNGHCCHGLFQINMAGALKVDRMQRYGLKSVAELYNPLVNSRVAFKMSKKGTNWSAWSVNPHKRSGSEYPGIVTRLSK